MEVADTGGDLRKILLIVEQIDACLMQLAAQIGEEYRGRDLLLAGVLRRVVMTMADLLQKIRAPLGMGWMVVSSYGSGTKSSGVVRILKDLDIDIQGRNVLIVEDVIDSRSALSQLGSNLLSRSPESVCIATTLRKPGAAKAAIDMDCVGSGVPDEFIMGRGLDYTKRYRHLLFMGAFAPHIHGG